MRGYAHIPLAMRENNGHWQEKMGKRELGTCRAPSIEGRGGGTTERISRKEGKGI